MSYDTKAIVLKKSEFGDYGIISIVFTKDFGKLTLINKKIRRYESFASFLDIASYNEINFIENSYSNINKLVRVNLIDKFSNIYNDLNRIFSVLKVIEVISHCLPEREQHKNIFSLFLELINKINLDNPNNYLWNIIIFYIYLLKHIGFLFSFTHCIICGQEKKIFEKISFLKGGCICNNCNKTNDKYMSISKNLYFYFQDLVKLDYNLIKNIKPNIEEIKEMQIFLILYFEYIIGKQLKVFSVEKDCYSFESIVK